MLPFMKHSKEASVSVAPGVVTRKSDHEDSDEYDSMHSAMEEFGAALDKKDYKTAAEIFRSAFELLDSEPHEEGPHTNE